MQRDVTKCYTILGKASGILFGARVFDDNTFFLFFCLFNFLFHFASRYI